MPLENEQKGKYPASLTEHEPIPCPVPWTTLLSHGPLSVNHRSTSAMTLCPGNPSNKLLWISSKRRRGARGEGVLSDVEHKQNLWAVVPSSSQSCHWHPGRAVQGGGCCPREQRSARFCPQLLRGFMRFMGISFCNIAKEALGTPPKLEGIEGANKAKSKTNRTWGTTHVTH